MGSNSIFWPSLRYLKRNNNERTDDRVVKVLCLGRSVAIRVGSSPTPSISFLLHVLCLSFQRPYAEGRFEQPAASVPLVLVVLLPPASVGVDP